MKKNLTRIISLVLVMLMVLPVSVFAAEPAIEASVYYDGVSAGIVLYDGGTKNSVKLSVPGETVLTWYTNSTGKNFIDIAADGTITAKNIGNAVEQKATVYAALDNDKGTVAVLLTVKKYNVVAIEIQEDTKSDFVAGQKISKSDIHVDAYYSDGTVAEDITDFTFEPAGALTTDIGSLIVTYSKNTNLTDNIPIKVANVDLEDFVESIEIVSPTANKEYAAGDILKPADIQIKIKNVGGNSYTYATAAQNDDIKVTIAIGNKAKEWSKTAGYTFSNDDITSTTKECVVTVEYAGKVATTELVVKEKSGSGSTTNSRYTASVVTAPTKKNYVVGDMFKIDGAKFTIKYDGVVVASTYLSDFSISYTFKAADVGKTSFDFDLLFKHNGTYKVAKVTISGLSVATEATYVDEYATQILDVVLKQEKYPVDYTFSLKDIEYVWGRFAPIGTSSSLGTSKTVSYDELILFRAYRDGEIDIEVLAKDGKRKSSLRAHKLQEGDVVNGEATLRFFFGDETYDVEIEVGEPDISYIYAGVFIAEYDALDDALDYTIEQDPAIPTTEFDLSKIPTGTAITLKLGRDFTLPSLYDFNPERNVEIDLNGNDLTLKSDQIEVLRANSTRKVTVTNTSEEESTLVYSDLDITVVLAEGESVTFTHGGDVPGIVYVTINKVNNGKVTADREITDSEITVGYGSDIKFTITPNSGYVIDSLKVDTTVITAKEYSVATNGVVTYVLEDVKDDATLYVTFKKGTASDDWTNPWSNYTTNPFRDVSKTSTYYSAVRFVYTKGLFQGTETNKFEPNTTMTRAMFVTVLGRLAEENGIKVTRYTNSSYTDVVVNKDTNWYTPYVEWATRNGIVEGHGDGTFGPDEEITHEQMYVIMYRYTLFVENISTGNVSNVSINSITDRASISDWALNAVKYAYKNDFVIYPSSTSKKIAPQGAAKRSELAMLLEKYCVTILGWENN